MTDNEIKHFRSRMHDVMTGNISKEEAACMRERRKQIDSTYNEFIKANGGILQVLEIQGENSKRMAVGDFLRGNPVGVGNMFE